MHGSNWPKNIVENRKKCSNIQNRRKAGFCYLKRRPCLVKFTEQGLVFLVRNRTTLPFLISKNAVPHQTRYKG